MIDLKMVETTIEEKMSPRSLSYKNFHKRRNYGRVNIDWRIFEKTAKKTKNEVTGPKKVNFWKVFR